MIFLTDACALIILYSYLFKIILDANLYKGVRGRISQFITMHISQVQPTKQDLYTLFSVVKNDREIPLTINLVLVLEEDGIG